jgi:hypothetical protein
MISLYFIRERRKYLQQLRLFQGGSYHSYFKKYIRGENTGQIAGEGSNQCTDDFNSNPLICFDTDPDRDPEKE